MPEYSIENETDTIGHLLQEYLLRQDDIYFCAYKRIHPLKRGILIQVESIESTENVESANKQDKYDFTEIVNDIERIEKKLSTL